MFHNNALKRIILFILKSKKLKLCANCCGIRRIKTLYYSKIIHFGVVEVILSFFSMIICFVTVYSMPHYVLFLIYTSGWLLWRWSVFFEVAGYFSKLLFQSYLPFFDYSKGLICMGSLQKPAITQRTWRWLGNLPEVWISHQPKSPSFLWLLFFFPAFLTSPHYFISFIVNSILHAVFLSPQMVKIV